MKHILIISGFLYSMTSHASGVLNFVTLSTKSHTAVCAVKASLRLISNQNTIPPITSIGRGASGSLLGDQAALVFFDIPSALPNQNDHYAIVIYEAFPDSLHPSGYFPWLWLSGGDGTPSLYSDHASSAAEVWKIKTPNTWLQWEAKVDLGKVDISECQ